MEEVFKKDSMDAKITIEVGDYQVMMEGMLAPPSVKTHRWDNEFYHHDQGIMSDGLTEISLILKPTEVIKIERFKWSIPLTIRPRIEP